MFAPENQRTGGFITIPGLPLKREIAKSIADQQLKLNWKPPKNPRAHLLALPLELKQQICEHLFHLPSESKRPCEIDHHLTGQNMGCRCGESLSMVSKDTYKETRSLFYNCANFVFLKPEACQMFMNTIGSHCLEVGSLDITYRNTIYESSLLQGIFKPLKMSHKLVHLLLRVKARDEEPYQHLPIYIFQEPAVDAATLWDLELRPMHHPLADLKALRKLTIKGHPGISEIEEVLFRASKNVERLAISQKRYQRTRATWTSKKVLSYSIESIPDGEEEDTVSADSQLEGEYPFDGLLW